MHPDPICFWPRTRNIVFVNRLCHDFGPQRFHLNSNALFLWFTDLLLHHVSGITLCDIRGDVDVDRALLLSCKYHQMEEQQHHKERTRGMPEVDDKPQYNHGE